jgi:hypothetical protein
VLTKVDMAFRNKTEVKPSGTGDFISGAGSSKQQDPKRYIPVGQGFFVIEKLDLESEQSLLTIVKENLLKKTLPILSPNNVPESQNT